MKAKLIKYLVCCECKGPLEPVVFREDQSLPWSEIMEGGLTCKACGREYPICNGVPRLLAGPLPEEVQQTVTGFGWEWLTFDSQIQDTCMTGKDHFLDFIYPVTEADFTDRLVLDAGCGMGRFLKLGAEFGSREIIGIDLSDSVEAAYRNTRLLANAHVVQADICALPFVSQFDYIFSVGVLHHMQNPEEGFAQLARLLNDNGRISVWVYAEENNAWVIHLLSPLRKYLTSRLPRRVLYFMSQFLGLILYACVKLIYKPANERVGLGGWLPYDEYLHYYSRFTYGSLVSIIFDHLVPQLAAYISRDVFESWFHQEDLADVTITARNNMSWRGLGTRIPALETGSITTARNVIAKK